MTIKVFLDCEFTSFEEPNLISIGLVTEDGNQSFYSELTDTYTLEDCSAFVILNVLPLLDAKPFTLPIKSFTNLHAKMSLVECSLYLKRWINNLNDSVVMLSDAPHYDFTFITEILYDDWPPLLAKTCDTGSAETADGQLAYDETTRQALQNGYREHHSLDDAKVIAIAYAAMIKADIDAPSSQLILNNDLIRIINSKIRK